MNKDIRDLSPTPQVTPQVTPLESPQVEPHIAPLASLQALPHRAPLTSPREDEAVIRQRSTIEEYWGRLKENDVLLLKEQEELLFSEGVGEESILQVLTSFLQGSIPFVTFSTGSISSTFTPCTGDHGFLLDEVKGKPGFKDLDLFVSIQDLNWYVRLAMMLHSCTVVPMWQPAQDITTKVTKLKNLYDVVLTVISKHATLASIMYTVATSEKYLDLFTQRQ